MIKAWKVVASVALMLVVIFGAILVFEINKPSIEIGPTLPDTPSGELFQIRFWYIPWIVLSIFVVIGVTGLFFRHWLGKLSSTVGGWLLYLVSIAPHFIVLGMAMALLYGGWASFFVALWYPLWASPTTRWMVSGRGVITMQGLPDFVRGVAEISLMVLFALGLVFLVTGIFYFARAKVRGRVLAEDGVYALTRHPMYFGVTLMAFPFGISGPPLGFVSWILLIFMHLALAESEERKLVKKIGYRYKLYKKRAPFFLPLAPSFLREKFGFSLGSWRQKVFFALVCVSLMILAFMALWFLNVHT